MLSSRASPERAIAPAARATHARVRPLLGTFVAIRVDVGDGAGAPAAAARAAELAFARIAELHRCMSFHDPDSELSRLNRDAHRGWQRTGAALRRVLRAALALARASGGAFDPSVGGQLVAAGLLPAPDGGPAPDPAACWRDVELGADGRVRFAKPLWLDLGGIAKGFAVDEAVRALQQQGIRSGVVNAGGDLRCFGRLETVRVRDPSAPSRSLPLLEVRDAAVATSAGYFGAGPRSALLRPADGADVGQGVSATVWAPRAIWADGLTKVILAAPDRAPALLARLGARAMLLDSGGQRLALH